VLTLPVVTEKFAEVAPDGTVTDVGTPAAEEFELDSVTMAPAAGAASVRLTVPEPGWPPTIVPGDTETLLSATAGGFTVNPNVSLMPARDAVKVTGVGVATPPAVTGNVVDVENCGTVTVVDMLTSMGNALRLMVVPPS
jgi:hypothetical protein